MNLKSDKEIYESEKRMNEWRERWKNPTVCIQSENAYSVVVKDERYSKNMPLRRYRKQKDENGLFIILPRNKRVYEKSWKRNY